MTLADWTTEAPWTGTRAPLREATGLGPAAYVDADYFEHDMAITRRLWFDVNNEETCWPTV